MNDTQELPAYDEELTGDEARPETTLQNREEQAAEEAPTRQETPGQQAPTPLLEENEPTERFHRPTEAEWIEFVRQYPHQAEAGRLDPEVCRRIRQGESPVSAQRAVENENLRRQLQAYRAAGLGAALPRSARSQGDKPDRDPFLTGLDWA